MTQNEFKKFREDILRGFQLTSTPTVKSILALFFSGLISTYGIYSILLSVGIEGNTLYKAIGIFVLILIVADTFKRGALSNYYNSQIRNIIIGAKVLKMQLIVSLLALSFMTVFDVVGSFSTANYVEAKYQEFQATNSKEFELLESNAKNGQTELSLYSQELSVWQQDKKDAYQVCSEKWRGWKAKYKAKCKKSWEDEHQKPIKPNASSSVSVSDYKSVKEDTNSDFLSEYIFYIILFLSMALTMLLQYTTISEIQNNKDEIDQSLTSMVIGILQDRLKELETNMVQHETKRNELISTGDKEEKKLNRDFEKRGKAISLISMKKAVDARGKTVERIANNEAMPTTIKKAGFVHNPFNESVSNQSVKPNGYNQTVKPKEEKEPKNDSTNSTVNQTVITERLTDRLDSSFFTDVELELITILWDGNNVKHHDPLVTRKEVLKVIGDTKINTNLLRDLYKKLLKHEYIYKRVGYFAKVELCN